MIASETVFNVLCMSIYMKGGVYLPHMPATEPKAIIKEGWRARVVHYGGDINRLGPFATGLNGMVVTVDILTKHGRIQLYTDIPTSGEYSSERIREFAAREVSSRPYIDIGHFLVRCNY
jgi:hypothetical protein